MTTLIARTLRPRPVAAAGLLLACAIQLGCSSQEAGPAPPSGPTASAAGGAGGAPLSAQDVSNKRFDESPAPKGPNRR
jgi:hypothetical protein